MAFSQPLEGKCIHQMRESIVLLLFWEKKINELSTVMIILQNDWESGGFRMLSD